MSHNIRKDRRVPWIVPYKSRKKFTRKIKKVLESIKTAKDSHDWYKCSKLKSRLRHTWWGTKKYTK